MDQPCHIPYEDVRALTLTVLRTGVMLSDLLADLLEQLPREAFAGETHVDVLIEMVSGTITPVAEAAGAETVETTIALLEAAGDRVLADLGAAVELARRDA